QRHGAVASVSSGSLQASHIGPLKRSGSCLSRHRTHPVATRYRASSRRQAQTSCHPHFGGDHVHTVSPAIAQGRRTGFADETVAHSPTSSLMVIWPSALSRSRCAAISALRPCLQGVTSTHPRCITATVQVSL